MTHLWKITIDLLSLLPSISKILEKLLYKRLFTFLTDNNLLVSNQFEFRKGHSTIKLRLTMTIRYNYKGITKEHISEVFMDLSQAFDTFDHKSKSYGVRGVALPWFSNYLVNNTYVLVNIIPQITCAVPQGSMLVGPLL